MTLSDLNPHIRYAGIHLTQLHYSKKFSICYDCRLFFIVNASGFVTVNDKKYNIANGTALYFPPRTKYRFSFNADSDIKIIVINFDLINKYEQIKDSLGTATENTFSPERVPQYEITEFLLHPIVKQIPQIQNSLEICADNFLKKTNFFRETSSALLKLCLLEMAHQHSKRGTYSELCEQVLSYIHENFHFPTLTNSEIAEKFNYHPYHLSRIIKQETGKTLHQYLISYRLRIAKNFLRTTQYDMEEISWRSGFCSAAYFIKIFREHTGMTPKKYRTLRFYGDL